MSNKTIIDKSIENNEICAVIITYNGIDTIKNTLQGIYNNGVNSIVAVDNNSTDGTIDLLKKENIRLILNDRNMGIAYALNQGFENAIKLGFTWVLTMDQDSIFKDNAIEKMIDVHSVLVKGFRIGILAPKILYTNIANQDFIENDSKYRMKKTVITSGNLVSINAYKEVGGFTNELFIDSVDFDFSLRVYNSGYRTFICNNSILYHSLGQKKRIRIGLCEFDIHLHSIKRKYFMSRNFIFIIKKHFNKHKLFCLKMSVFFMIFVLQAITLEKKRIKNITSITRGVIAGIKNNYNNEGVM